MKYCSRCGAEKSLTEFSRDRHHSSGYKSACKECAAIDFSNWRNSNLEYAREADRKLHYIRTYKFSTETASKLAKDRTGICKICGSSTLLVVDHCHTTGKVRGLVCSSCNSMLGYAKDNIKTLHAGIAYLKEFYEL